VNGDVRKQIAYLILEYWNNGMMEDWVKGFHFVCPTIPFFQYSIIVVR